MILHLFECALCKQLPIRRLREIIIDTNGILDVTQFDIDVTQLISNI